MPYGSIMALIAIQQQKTTNADFTLPVGPRVQTKYRYSALILNNLSNNVQTGKHGTPVSHILAVFVSP